MEFVEKFTKIKENINISKDSLPEFEFISAKI